jgi:hypothetical protein
MNIDLMTVARARLAIQEAVRDYLLDPRQQIYLVDFGQKEIKGQTHEDQLAIRFHGNKRSSFELEAAGIPPIPKFIGPFDTSTDFQSVKPFQLHQWLGWGSWWAPPRNPRMTRADPLRGGISISDEYHYAAGTLGGKVKDRATGSEMILSNWHVLVGEWTAWPGQRIYQPGRLDGGTSADTVATLTRDAMAANLDAAVATLTGVRRLINDQVDFGPVKGVGRARPGMEVVKSGRTSEKTYGRVTGVEGTMVMPYGYIDRIIRNVVTIDQRVPGEQVSSAGDSGSWWLDTATRQVIGLHFAGSDVPERGLALDMQSVLDALNVDISVAP